MSSSTTLAFVSSIFIVLFVSNLIVTSANDLRHSNPLIAKACSHLDPHIPKKLCIQELQSQPNITSATNLFDISIAIIESGISSAASTRDYIEVLLRLTEPSPSLKAAEEECKSSYDDVIVSFTAVLNDVRAKDLGLATYDLKPIADIIRRCIKNVDSGEITDTAIAFRNNDVLIFSSAAHQIIDSLDNKKKM